MKATIETVSANDNGQAVVSAQILDDKEKRAGSVIFTADPKQVRVGQDIEVSISF